MSVPFENRKEGNFSPEQNKSTLEQIPFDEFHICHPEHYVALLREIGHMNYNADTANRARNSLLTFKFKKQALKTYFF